MNHTIYHTFEITAPATTVFRSIVVPEHLVNWWPLRCTGKPVMGEIYNFYFGEPYNWYGKVAEITENKSFSIKMTDSDPDWDPTTFGFFLEEETEGKVKVQFFHSDWPECNNHFKVASFCWAMLLNGLKQYVEKGHIIPFEERA